VSERQDADQAGRFDLHGAAALRHAARMLYESNARRSQVFRYALLALDLVTVLYIVASSFAEAVPAARLIDTTLGILFLLDFLVRLWIDRRPLLMLASPVGLAEMAAIVSFLTPTFGGAAGFLRVLRTLRFLHSYQVGRRLRKDFPIVRRYEELAAAILHLAVFLFITTALVYESQAWRNEQIGDYVDALYFTVTALTTTGFGDITLLGTDGRLLSVLIMIFGVTLFLRLAHVLFRPTKVRQECEHCGLQRHEPDAVHCKHCGNLIHLDSEGEPWI